MAGGERGRKLGPRVSDKQMSTLLKELQKNPFLTRKSSIFPDPNDEAEMDSSALRSLIVIDQETAAKHKQMWDKLTSVLNAEGPAVKSRPQWKQFWNAKVCKARFKHREIRTGKCATRLTGQERSVLTLAGRQKSSRSRWDVLRPDAPEQTGEDGHAPEKGSANDSESDVGDGEGSHVDGDESHLADNQSDEDDEEVEGGAGSSDSDYDEQSGRSNRGSAGGSTSRASTSARHSRHWVSCGPQDCSAALLQLVEVQKSSVHAVEKLTEAVKNQTELIATAMDRIEKHLRPAVNVPCPTPPSN